MKLAENNQNEILFTRVFARSIDLERQKMRCQEKLRRRARKICTSNAPSSASVMPADRDAVRQLFSTHLRVRLPDPSSLVRLTRLHTAPINRIDPFLSAANAHRRLTISRNISHRYRASDRTVRTCSLLTDPLSSSFTLADSRG